MTISVRQATRHDWPALQRLFLLSRCHTFTWLNVTDFRLTDLEKQTEGETIWLARNRNALAFYAASGFITIDEGVSDEGAYRLLERKGAWPQQAAKKMRPQAHR